MRKREYYIDGIKFICAILIIMTHTFPAAEVNDFLRYLIQNHFGYIGTSMFFMLSGFLMARGYKTRLSKEEGRTPFINYLFNRIKKIYPIYFITNLVCIIFHLIYYPSTISIKLCLEIFLMVTGGSIFDYLPYNFPTWFVNTLLVCYAIYYFVVVLSLGKKQSNRLYNILLVLLIIYGWFLMQNHFDFPFMYLHTGEGVFNFFIGVLLNEFFDRIKKTHTIIIGIVFSLLSVLILTNASVFVTNNYRTIFSLINCPSIIILGHNVGFLNKGLAAIGSFFSTLSMPLIFWQIPVWNFYFHYTEQNFYQNSPMAHWICYLGILFLVSIIYNYISDNTNKRIKSKKEQAKLAPV